MGKMREMFAGGNTSLGFYSFFEYIIGDDARNVFLLKGGPGTGKSVFMKEISKAVMEAGYESELFYCSSDRESLDGAAFPQLGVALIDATAPHVQEPRLPGCRDELINLGDFWDRQGIVQHRKAIEDGSSENRLWFQSAFCYLRAAYAVEENIVIWNRSRIPEEAIFKVGSHLLNCIFKNYRQSTPVSRRGRVRHLFASAITPQGQVSFVENLAGSLSNRYILVGPPGAGKSEVLQRIIRSASETGIDVEAFHYPLNPEEIEHVLLPELQTAIVSATEAHPLTDLEGYGIDLTQDRLRENRFSEDYALRETLIHEAVRMLGKAKNVHDELERYYASQMDFTALSELKNAILKRVLS